MTRPSPKTPLEKRIRRHVSGPEREFFVSTAPGLESILLREIEALFPGRGTVTETEGGAAFVARLRDCYLANLSLRTAHRVLMRLAAFRATNFSQLRRRLSDLPWELYLKPGTVPEVRVTARHSRLRHTVALESHVREAVRERLLAASGGSPVPAGKPEARIFVRVLEDRFTLSLDSTGELLYKRGIKRHRARAPIRETIAAGALISAGFDGSRPLVDPMCGSGTFSLEAALISRALPPGWFREFAFMDWPAFSTGQWAHMRKEAERGFRPPPNRPSIFASDIDEKACSMLEKALHRVGLSDTVEVTGGDFFDSTPPSTGKGPGIVTLNPPYGRRIGTPRESGALFREICRKLAKDFRGWDFVLVIPGKHLLRDVPFSFRAHPFHHGGLDLCFITGSIP